MYYDLKFNKGKLQSMIREVKLKNNLFQAVFAIIV